MLNYKKKSLLDLFCLHCSCFFVHFFAMGIGLLLLFAPTCSPNVTTIATTSLSQLWSLRKVWCTIQLAFKFYANWSSSKKLTKDSTYGSSNSKFLFFCSNTITRNMQSSCLFTRWPKVNVVLKTSSANYHANLGQTTLKGTIGLLCKDRNQILFWTFKAINYFGVVIFKKEL